MNFKKQFFGWMMMGMVLVVASSCKKDKEDDQTVQVVGTYMGSYAESTDGSTVTVDEVETVVTKEDANSIEVDIQVFPGLATVKFVAEMTDETHFTVSKFTLYDDEVQGSGSLSNGTLSVDLDKVGSASADKITFEGIKQ